MTVSGRFVFADSYGVGAGGFEPPFPDTWLSMRGAGQLGAISPREVAFYAVHGSTLQAISTSGQSAVTLSMDTT